MQSRPRVLLVEDEPLIRLILADALDSAGHSIIESGTGEDALTQLAITGFAAVVTDIRLGAGPSGWDVARAARQQHPHIAVVYMTGDSAADWASEGVPTSILVQKPFAMAQMITAVSSLLISAAAPLWGPALGK
ncbi:MAG: response regulator [Rhizorhabdus sp.]